jgi:hypothetical protein
MPDLEVVERFEDMSPRGRLKLVRQPDGDVIVVAIPDPEQRNCMNAMGAMVEFCTPCAGGGQSPRTLAALRALYEAMELDNRENPQHRK